MADPTGSGAGDHLYSLIGEVFGVVLGWFGNLIYMRDKFIEKDSCKECKNSTSASHSIQIDALQGRMGTMETCVSQLYTQSKENHGLICEIHGFLKGQAKKPETF